MNLLSDCWQNDGGVQTWTLRRLGIVMSCTVISALGEFCMSDMGGGQEKVLTGDRVGWSGV